MPEVKTVIWIILHCLGSGHLYVIHFVYNTHRECTFVSDRNIKILIRIAPCNILHIIGERLIAVVGIVVGIYHLGEAAAVLLQLLLILLHALLGLIVTILGFNLLVVVVEVAYRLVDSLVTGLAVALGNSSIHSCKLALIIGHILLGHSHDALVVLLNHADVGIDLSAVYALNLEAVCPVLLEILLGKRLFEHHCRILELIAILIYALLNYLNNTQVLEL